MTTRLPWPLVFQILGVVAAVWLVIRTWHVWLLVLIALVLAAAILPAARRLERHGVPCRLTVLAIYLLAAALLVLMGRLFWPALSEQGRQFMDALPRMLDNVKGWIGDLRAWIEQWGAGVPTPKRESMSVDGILGPLLANTLAATAGAVGAVVGLLASGPWRLPP